MKYRYILIISFFFACSHQDMKDPVAYFDVEQASLDIESEGKMFTLKVESSAAWTAQSDADWCKVLASTAILSGEVGANTGAAAREATITLTCGEMIKKVIVVQLGTNGKVPNYMQYELFKFLKTEFQYDSAYRITGIVNNGLKDVFTYSGNELISIQRLVEEYETSRFEEVSRVTYSRSGNDITRISKDVKFNIKDSSRLALNENNLPVLREGVDGFGIRYHYTYVYDQNNNLIQRNYYQRDLLMRIMTATYDTNKGIFSDVRTAKWWYVENGAPSHAFNNCVQEVEKNRLYENLNDEGVIPDGQTPIYSDEIQKDEYSLFEYDNQGYPSKVGKPRQVYSYIKIK